MTQVWVEVVVEVVKLVVVEVVVEVLKMVVVGMTNSTKKFNTTGP